MEANKNVEIDRIIFYDKSCVLCNSVLSFLLKRKPDRWQAIPLNSERSAQYLDESLSPDSIIYLREENKYIESRAVLEIIKDLGFPFAVLYIFRCIPRSWRDQLYRFIAARRYLIAGKYEACEIPNIEEDLSSDA